MAVVTRLRDRALGRRGRGMLTGAAALLSATALAVPAAVYLHAAAIDPDATPRHGAPDVALDATTVASIEELDAAAGFDQPVVLSYHDIRELEPGEDPDDHYTVTPEQFARHVAALDRAGFHTIGSDDFARWLDGEPLPPRSVYLTFDDGTTGLWRHADAVLEAHDMQAAVFVITGRVGSHRPYYLDWDELAEMAATGRWDIESHTRLGHDRIPVDADGETLPFLINRAWLPEEGRNETLDEVLDRVRTDLAGSRADFVAAGLEEPRFFAFPFSAENRPTNDERIPSLVADEIQAQFDAAFSNDEPDRLVSERDRLRRSLSRIEVFRFTTAAGLLERLAEARPLDPGAGLDPLDDPDGWVDSSGRSLVESERHAASGAMPDSPYADWASFEGDSQLLAAPDAGRYLGALYAPGRSEDWAEYVAAVTVGGLGTEPEVGPSASLHALVGSSLPLQLSVSSGFVRFQHGAERVEQGIPPADRHRLELRIDNGHVTASVDGAVLADVPVPAGATGGIALGASGVPAASDGVTFEHLRVGGPDDPAAEPTPPPPPVAEVEEPAPEVVPPAFEPEPPAAEWPVEAPATEPAAPPAPPPTTTTTAPPPPPTTAPPPPPTTEPEHHHDDDHHGRGHHDHDHDDDHHGPGRGRGRGHGDR